MNDWKGETEFIYPYRLLDPDTVIDNEMYEIYKKMVKFEMDKIRKK
jgi:hypothetical protein